MWLEVMSYHRTTQGRRNVAGGDDISIELLKAGAMWLEVMPYHRTTQGRRNVAGGDDISI